MPTDLPISLELNLPHRTMWGLLTRFMLTPENPGPEVLNFMELSKEEQKSVIMGLRLGHVKSTNRTVDQLFTAYSGGTPEEAKPPTKKVAPIIYKAPAPSGPPSLETEAKVLLQGSLSKVRTFVARCENKKLVETLLFIEGASEKPRGRLVTFLKEKLTSLRDVERRKTLREARARLGKTVEGEPMKFKGTSLVVEETPEEVVELVPSEYEKGSPGEEE